MPWKQEGAVALRLVRLFTAHDQQVRLAMDRKIRFGEPGHCERDAIGILAGLLDVIGRVARRGLFEPGDLIDQREQPVKTDGGTMRGARSKERMAYPPSSDMQNEIRHKGRTGNCAAILGRRILEVGSRFLRFQAPFSRRDHNLARPPSVNAR